MSLSVMQKEAERGSILIIVVAVVMIISVALTFGLSKLKTQDNFERSLETQRKIDRIYIELANYVHQNNRLPCPYFPYLDGGNLAARIFSNMRSVLSGTESLVPTGEAGVCGGGVFGFPSRGILPFRTLNLNEDDVKDAWGRFFVYGVSEAFTETYFTRSNPEAMTMNLGPDNDLGQKGTTPGRQPDIPPPAPPAADPSSNVVMAACRTDGTAGGSSSANRWIINARDDAGGPLPININPQKAFFCCTGRHGGNRDVVKVVGKGTTYTLVDPSPYNTGGINTIIGPVGSAYHQLRHTQSFAGFPARADMDTPATAVALAQVIGTSTTSSSCSARGCSTEGWAFVVASVGPDGIPQSTRGWPYGTTTYGGAWNPGAVNVNSRYSGTHGTIDDAYDDIVLMKTNFDLMSKLNSGTCQTPFYSYQR
jgi:hypothetical protein